MRKTWIALAFLVAASTAPLRAQVPMGLDSLFRNSLVANACLAARPDGDHVVVDSVAPQTYASPCEGWQGAVAFVRDSAVTEPNVRFLNRLILNRRPDFYLMCAMTRAEGPVWCDAQIGGER